MRPKKIALGAGIERSADFGVGKWSRIATYGPKKQLQPDGSWYETVFDDAKFEKSLENFRIMFAARGRGMGSDFEHQTLYASQNGRAAPNPAYFTALAWVKNDALQALEALRDGIPPIDPTAEAERLRQEHPKAESHSPDGVWAYCSEVTDVGRLLIPSYSQLSPLFNEEEHDEAGNFLGFAFLNVSFVNVAHQTGTNFAFGKFGKGFRMDPTELRKKLGLGDAPTADQYKEALAAYLLSTDDPKEMRKALAEACEKAMSEGAERRPEDEDDDELKDEEMQQKLAHHGLGDAPTAESYSKALSAYLAGTDDSKKVRQAVVTACRKAMSRLQQGAMGAVNDALARQLAAADQARRALAKEVGDLKKDRQERELAEVLAEAKTRGITEPEARTFYAQFGKAGALQWFEKFPKKGGAMGKWSIGGGNEPRPTEGSAVERVNGVPVIGRGLSKLAREMVKKGEAKSIREAQLMVARQAPHLYTNPTS